MQLTIAGRGRGQSHSNNSVADKKHSSPAAGTLLVKYKIRFGPDWANDQPQWGGICSINLRLFRVLKWAQTSRNFHKYIYHYLLHTSNPQTNYVKCQTWPIKWTRKIFLGKNRISSWWSRNQIDFKILPRNELEISFEEVENLNYRNWWSIESGNLAQVILVGPWHPGWSI